MVLLYNSMMESIYYLVYGSGEATTLGCSSTLSTAAQVKILVMETTMREENRTTTAAVETLHRP